MEIRLEPRKVAWFFALTILFLVVVHTVGQVFVLKYGSDHQFAFIRSKFDLDGEKNVPALYSSVAIIFCSLLLTLIARARHKQGKSFVLHWYLLAAIFLFLGIDESIAFHESLHEPMVSMLNLSGLLFAGWVVPAGIALILFLAFYAKFTFKLPARTRWLFIIAGVVYVSGAMIMEMFGAGFLDSLGGIETTKQERGIPWAIFVTVEETLEMSGIVVFIYALLDYMNSKLNDLRIRISAF